MKLKSATIKNFKSLADVELKFRDLTILVGANASGKSNCLGALGLLKLLLENRVLPPVKLMLMQQMFLRQGQNILCISINLEHEKNHAEYSVSLKLVANNTVIESEKLTINKIEVINIYNGEGEVKDEDGKNQQKYTSNPEEFASLALKSAGSFGNKPVTKKIATYIANWQFYNIDPDSMKRNTVLFDLDLDLDFDIFAEEFTTEKARNKDNYILDSYARKTQKILTYWAKNEKDKFSSISQELDQYLQISLIAPEEKKSTINVYESGGNKIPLHNMSDGTLRFIAYLIMLHQSDLPPLISIEEPERNLHPGILKNVASIIKKLSQKTQVIFTTHSSQLLDCFSTDEVFEDISVILLSKKDESGTKAYLLDELKEKHEDLLDWMNDFGLGSAIYHSNLLQEVLGN